MSFWLLVKATTVIHWDNPGFPGGSITPLMSRIKNKNRKSSTLTKSKIFKFHAKH